jgi:hypothetical protein
MNRLSNGWTPQNHLRSLFFVLRSPIAVVAHGDSTRSRTGNEAPL